MTTAVRSMLSRAHTITWSAQTHGRKALNPLPKPGLACVWPRRGWLKESAQQGSKPRGCTKDAWMHWDEAQFNRQLSFFVRWDCRKQQQQQPLRPQLNVGNQHPATESSVSPVFCRWQVVTTIRLHSAAATSIPGPHLGSQLPLYRNNALQTL
jgi:hypothetical protein